MNINLEKIIIKHTFNSTSDTLLEDIKSAMMDLSEQILQLASKNAELKVTEKLKCDVDVLSRGFIKGNLAIIVDKDSILNVINRIE